MKVKNIFKLILISIFAVGWLGFFPVKALANMQIYPYNTSTGGLDWYTTKTTSGANGSSCNDSGVNHFTDKFYTETDGTQTYHSSSRVKYNVGYTDGCQNVNWGVNIDTTRTGAWDAHIESATYIQQKIKIPANVSKITRVKFYDIFRDTAEPENIAFTLSLYNNNAQLLSSLARTIFIGKDTTGPVDFTSFGWAVSPGSSYFIRLTRNSGGSIGAPVVSPIYAIMDGNNPHNTNDVYTDGYADTNASSFSILRDVNGIAKADLARTAIWGEGWTGPTCNANTAFTGCSLLGQARCTDYGSNKWPNWTTTLWSNCNTACNLANPDYYCAVCSLAADKTSINIPGSITYTLTTSQAANTAYWNGTDNGTTITPPQKINEYQSGTKSSTFTYNYYTSSQAGSYTRYVTFKDNTGILMCTTQPALNINISNAVPPFIQSLNVTADPRTDNFSGSLKTSGLQQSESGVNWFNPMYITLNATAYGTTATGTTNSIKQYFVAFYDKNEGTNSIRDAYPSIIANTTNSDPNANLKTLLINNPAAGFLLAYNPGINPPTTGKHYVWDPTSSKANKWVDISSYSTNGWPICISLPCTLTNTYYKAYPVSAGTWKIRLFSIFHSKSLYTAGYVTDTNGLSTYQADLNP